MPHDDKALLFEKTRNVFHIYVTSRFNEGFYNERFEVKSLELYKVNLRDELCKLTLNKSVYENL